MKGVHLGFHLWTDDCSLLPSSNLTPSETLRCSLCSFTLRPAVQDRDWDGDWYCFWHCQLLQGFLSANLWEPDYVLEVILWCLLIEGLGALTVCLFSVGDGKYFLFSLAQSNFWFSLCVGSKRSGPERFRGASAGTQSDSRRMAIIFLILVFWIGVQNLGWESQHKNLKRQEWSSVDFLFYPMLTLHVSIWRNMSKELPSVTKQLS